MRTSVFVLLFLLICTEIASRTVGLRSFIPFTLKTNGKTCQLSKLANIRGGRKEIGMETNKHPKSKSKASKREKLKEESEAEQLKLKVDTQGHFMNSNIFQTLSQFINRTPPITLVYLLISAFITILSFMFNHNQWPQFLMFNWNDILLRGCLWKLLSGFFYLGSLDIFYPLTLQFIHQNMSQLEKLFCKSPEEFFCLICFGCASLIVLYTVLGLPMGMLGHNLGSFLLYLWSKYFEGMDVNFMDILILKSEFLPYFFCLQSLLLERQFPYGDLIGILVGYFYYLLKERGYLQSPTFLKAFFAKNRFFSQRYAKLKDDFEL